MSNLHDPRHANICERIQLFSEQCEEEGYTDTEEAWELLDWIMTLLTPFEEPPQQDEHTAPELG